MMTFSAWLIRKAASSALPGFHGRCSFDPPPEAAASAPKPPAITLMKLRFIARPMMNDRIAPDEPTNAPVMIIAVLPSVKHIAAQAQPGPEESGVGNDDDSTGNMQWGTDQSK